ncbi:MAG: C25 family cysteine peptidase, partial [Candidatus Cloacimonadaceae bacterium]|nr:C25 family cysteine peptidase [Candidatus Cloacimonadaceae bacterium]
MPELPFYSTVLAIPHRGDYTISVREHEVKQIESVKVKPYVCEGSIFQSASYRSLEVFPKRVVEYSEPAILRDFRIIQINIFPLQWDAQSNNLRFSDTIELDIEFNDLPSINEMAEYNGYSPIFAKLYESSIANFAYYRNDELIHVHPRIQIIHGHNTDTTFQQKLTEFVAWKRQKGFDVQVASTQVAGSSNTAIKTYLQNQYNNPLTRPDFIILIGDTGGSFGVPAWFENYSSYNGEGDYPYTHLAGGDLLGDVFIGRISAENVSQLDILFSKIYAVEKNINNTPAVAAWLDRILLIGDPSSSGISTIYTNKFIKERARQVHPGYSFVENYSSGFASTINQAINQGVAFFNYRGYIGMSQWSPSSTLVNGFRLPHAVIITCSTGSYSTGTSTTEAFIRLGSSASPSGALTAIGMATPGTHTGYNNSLTAGIFDGIFTHKMRTMGEALLAGRLNLHNVYHLSNPTQVSYFAHWCNLMGDPTVDVFVGIPQTLNLAAPTSIPTGTHTVDFYVTDEFSNPVEAVSVTIFSNQNQSVVAKGFT